MTTAARVWWRDGNLYHRAPAFDHGATLMTTLPLWLAIYLSIGLSFALLCTASPARLRRNWQLARRGHPSYARCIGMVGIFMLFWPVLVVLAVRR